MFSVGDLRPAPDWELLSTWDFSLTLRLCTAPGASQPGSPQPWLQPLTCCGVGIAFPSHRLQLCPGRRAGRTPHAQWPQHPTGVSGSEKPWVSQLKQSHAFPVTGSPATCGGAVWVYWKPAIRRLLNLALGVWADGLHRPFPASFLEPALRSHVTESVVRTRRFRRGEQILESTGVARI